MRLTPAVFWRMTLAEWRATVDGYQQDVQRRRREQAWAVSLLMIAAGCDADKVTPAKLLGEKESKRRCMLDPETRKARDAKIIAERARIKLEKELAAAALIETQEDLNAK